MSSHARSVDRGRAVFATLVSAAFLWTLALSASPQLHASIHADANCVEHTCAATLIASGNYNNIHQPPVVRAPDIVAEFSRAPMLNPVWVSPLFFQAHIFAHAPPHKL